MVAILWNQEWFDFLSLDRFYDYVETYDAHCVISWSCACSHQSHRRSELFLSDNYEMKCLSKGYILWNKNNFRCELNLRFQVHQRFWTYSSEFDGPDYEYSLYFFNFETICWKNSSAYELLSKKYAIFVMFHGRKWRQGFWLVQKSAKLLSFFDFQAVTLVMDHNLLYGVTKLVLCIWPMIL